MNKVLGDTKQIILNTAGVFSIFSLFGFLVATILSPVNKTNAEELDVNVSVGSVISIYSNTSAAMSAQVNSFVSTPLNVLVSTNDQSGYTLRMSAIGTKTYMDSTTSKDQVTSTFEGTKTSSSMLDNTWGYSLNNTDYKAIPVETSAATIKQTTGPSIDPDYSTNTVYFGAKVGKLLTAGTYSDDVRFTAYANGANPDLVPTMQNFTCTINEHEVTSLKDSRDGNEYTVAKLKDGNCWMTQNLRLILNANRTLTSNNTDVPSDWTPLRGTIPTEELETYSWDRISLLTTPGSYNTGNNTSGVLYTWSAAVADNNTAEYTEDKQEANASICPKGWRLPNVDEVQKMHDVYYDDINFRHKYQPTDSPLNFVNGGVLWNHTLSTSVSQYWTSTNRNESSAYFLNTGYYDIGPGNTNRNYQMAVRCIAR